VVNFHPSDNELIEFSAGNTDWALSICISSHIERCPTCARKLRSFNKIGGATLSKCTHAPLSNDCFSNVLNKIKQNETEDHLQKGNTSPLAPTLSSVEKPKDQSKYSGHMLDDLPRVIQKLMPVNKRLHWKRIAPALHEAQITTGQDKYEVCFHKIKRGGKIAEHDHGGKEVTLVLRGSFSDEYGTYQAGDYLVREAGQTHRPLAAQNQDCLCLSVIEAPVKLTGLTGKLINPFLSFKPA